MNKLLLLILLFGYSLYHFKDYLFIKNKVIKETFSNSYQDCRSKGYTKEFCLTQPTALWGPHVCQCANGRMGRRLLGFGGKCVCGYIPKHNRGLYF